MDQIIRPGTGGAGGNVNPEEWMEWIMAYKGWDMDVWEAFITEWKTRADFASKNQLLDSEGIRIFTWGGRTIEEAVKNAGSEDNVDMIDELANQLKGMEDVTLVGWSKGGSLVMHYLKRLSKGEIEDGVVPLRAVLLAPATHPASLIPGPVPGWGGAGPQNNSVPENGPKTVNICSHGDRWCPLTIRNAWMNINPPKSQGHGPHGNYANRVIASLNVGLHHQAHGVWGSYRPQ